MQTAIEIDKKAMMIMEKYVTSIKDLVIQALTNESGIKEKANSGDAEACYKMGMIHLLGINTPIDLRIADNYFSNKHLEEDSDAQRLLGLLAELKGNYSSAFKYYAKAANCSLDGSDDLYIEKIRQEREKLRNMLNKWKLPVRVLNKVISSVLDDYLKGSDHRLYSIIKIAAICCDIPTCTVAAKSLSDIGDYPLAMQYLHIGNIGVDNLSYQMIERKLREMRNSIDISDYLQVIEIEGNSLLSDVDIVSVFAPARNALNKIADSCSRLWRKEVIPMIETIKKKWEKKEKERIRKEKKDRLEAEAEEEARKKRRKKVIKYSVIAAVVLLLYIIGSLGGGSEQSSDKVAAEDTILVNSEDESQTNEEVCLSLLSEKKLYNSDLEGKSKKELEIMRNSIYARHGYQFKREDLSNYFSQFSWYTPITNDMSAVYSDMSEIEKYNVDYIL